MNHELVAIDADVYQRRRLKLPKGDLALGDGRVCRRIIGYDISKLPLNPETISGIVESKGWRHALTGFVVSASIDDTPRWGPLLHVSMSYPDHDPAWDEIKQVKDVFFPGDMDAAMILPRKADWVNVHNHCFHLVQLPQEWGLL